MFSGTEVNFYLGMFLTSFVTKFIFALLLLLQDIPRVLFGGGKYIGSFISDNIKQPFIPSRRKFLTGIAVSLATIPFAAMLYGVTKGKYRYELERIKMKFSNLPPSFEGYKVVQISDIHAGSLDNKEEVMKGVNLINELNPDLVMFTGDLVNSNKDEIDPYIEVFNKIKAKDGKFAVLGNHDYYGLSDIEEKDKASYWEDFFQKYKRLGFELLNNRNVTLEKGKDSIKVVGVENWGAGRWFPKEGDLDVALQDVEQNEFCILLSHDPTHWDEKVLKHTKHIDLTLSGHTHGFQFGINMPGFSWSPAQYRYKRWMGAHEVKNQKLYVNKGFGFLAFPGRVGMWPEITLLELHKV